MPIQTIKNNNLTWVNITDAGDKEIDFLRKNFNFHKLDLADSYAKKHAQRPKLNNYPDYIFLILLFPIYKRKQREITIGEIDCFITGNTLITIHNNDLPPLVKLFNFSS